MLKTVKRQLGQRTRFLIRNREVGLMDRLRIVKSPRMGRAAMKYLVDDRLVEGPQGPHFQVQGQSIYFQPDFPVQNQSRLIDGISQVLVETFFFPDLFTPRVCVKPGDIVLDLGGNIGTTALLFSKLVGPEGRVFAFEPIVHGLCKRNIEENHAENVTVIPKGISDHSGETEFEVTDFCIDSSISNNGKEHRSPDGSSGKTSLRKAQLIRLDDWIDEQNLSRVDFIKIDIEGAEEQALLGAAILIATFRPKLSISSYHMDFTNSPQHPKLVRLLKQYGYQVEEHGKQHIFAW